MTPSCQQLEFSPYINKRAWPKRAHGQKKTWPKRTWPKISQLQHKIKSFVWVSTSDIRFKKVFWLEVFKYTVIYLTFDRKGVARDSIFAPAEVVLF